MLEEERKYEVDAGFAMPDLAPCLPSGATVVALPARRLRATYYDTEDLRLARAGASFRFRRGDREPWTVKLPTDTPGVRTEISARGRPDARPQHLMELVTALTRGAPLAEMAVVSTVRHPYELRDDSGRVLAEVVDDTVSVMDGKRVRLTFREVEVERKAGPAKLLDKVGKVLSTAGAVEGDFTPKHVRALGPAALKPPDWPRPAERLPDQATTGDVAVATVRRDIARIIRYDPLVRLRAEVGKEDSAVHKMRVGCRRLRSDLRTFAKVLDRDWADSLRADVAWLAEVLGAARDAEVLRTRLGRTAAADPVAPLDEDAVARIDAQLAARHEAALHELDEALRGQRYHQLLDTLLDAANAPRLNRRAAEPADALLPRLVGKPWRKLAGGENGAGQLAGSDPDERWHSVRIRGKRARYATEAAAVVGGGPALDLAELLGQVQELLGEHQDAAVAANAWLAIAAADPQDHAVAVTAGRLYERERAAVRAARQAFPAAWRAASRRRHTKWLR